MALFFDCKFFLLGGQKLCKDIAMDNLDKDDVYALEKGFLQLLPIRDQPNRMVIVMFPGEQDCDPG